MNDRPTCETCQFFVMQTVGKYGRCYCHAIKSYEVLPGTEACEGYEACAESK